METFVMLKVTFAWSMSTNDMCIQKRIYETKIMIMHSFIFHQHVTFDVDFRKINESLLAPQFPRSRHVLPITIKKSTTRARLHISANQNPLIANTSLNQIFKSSNSRSLAFVFSSELWKIFELSRLHRWYDN